MKMQKWRMQNKKIQNESREAESRRPEGQKKEVTRRNAGSCKAESWQSVFALLQFFCSCCCFLCCSCIRITLCEYYRINLSLHHAAMYNVSTQWGRNHTESTHRTFEQHQMFSNWNQCYMKFISNFWSRCLKVWCFISGCSWQRVEWCGVVGKVTVKEVCNFSWHAEWQFTDSPHQSWQLRTWWHKTQSSYWNYQVISSCRFIPSSGIC